MSKKSSPGARACGASPQAMNGLARSAGCLPGLREATYGCMMGRAGYRTWDFGECGYAIDVMNVRRR